MRFFAPFQKVEEQADGTLLVEGIASSEAEDSDGEVIRADAIRKALPDYMKYGGTGPLREMHQLRAAGRTIGADVADDGKTYISAKVVDTEAVKKVKEGVYVGFSVGGKVLKRNPDDAKVIEEMALVEISLVDRPANPDAVIQLWKADMPTQTERPFLKVSSIVTAFSKGKLSLDDAEKQVLELAKVAAGPGVVRKGMYQVARAAELMDGLASLEESCTWEAEYEGDQSGVPAMMGDAMRSFATALKALLDEELAELLGGEDAEKVAKGTTRAGDLAKAAGDAARKVADLMKTIRPAKTAAAAAPAGAGKEPPVKTDPQPPAAEPSEIEKAVAAVKAELDGKLAKALSDLEESKKAQSASHEALQRALEVREQIEKRQADDDAQAKQVAELVAKLQADYDAQISKVREEAGSLKQLAETATDAAKKANEVNEKLVAELAKRPKGVLRAVAVSKADDNGTGGGEENERDRLMKAAMDPESSEEARNDARRKLVSLSHSRPMRIG